MKNLTTTILTGAALTLLVSSPSLAKSADEVAFKYTPSATVEATYESLSKQAKKACDAELGPLVYYSAAKCVDRYVTDIVGKINRADMTAYHNSRGAKIVQMAQLDKSAVETK